MVRKMTFNAPGEAGDGPSTPHPTADHRFEVNPFEIARLLLTRRRMVIGVSFAVTVLTVVYMLLQPNVYTSHATILPSGNSGSANVSALKSLVGLGGASLGSADENSSELFPVILRSNTVVDAVLNRTYDFRDGDDTYSMTMREYLEYDNRDKARRAMRAITSISADEQTGEIYIGVETEYPELSRAVLAEYLNCLEDFNANKRRSAARENMVYLQKQINQVETELGDAENALERFQEANRDWATTDNPQVLKQAGRLQRTVQAKSTTYLTLLQQLEVVKLDVQKDIPIVRMLDQPSLPAMKSGPFRRNIIILSGFLTFLLCIAAAFVYDLFKQGTSGENAADYATLRSEMQATFPRTSRLTQRVVSRFDREPVS